MEETPEQNLNTLAPGIAAQMRELLSDLHIAAVRLAPPVAREQDHMLDVRAAALDQAYYQLFRLANDLDTAASLERKEPLSLLNEDVVEIVQDIFCKTESLTEDMGVEWTFSAWKDRHFCAVHRDGLEKICYQLFSNALKFTRRGGQIAVRLETADGWVRLTVCDNGTGMTKEQLAWFCTGAEQTERLLPPSLGSGLGLLLCRRIAEQMGGMFSVQSEAGSGTQVCVSLPDVPCKRSRFCDQPFDYAGGFNQALLGLADALPLEAFLLGRAQG